MCGEGAVSELLPACETRRTTCEERSEAVPEGGNAREVQEEVEAHGDHEELLRLNLFHSRAPLRQAVVLVMYNYEYEYNRLDRECNGSDTVTFC